VAGCGSGLGREAVETAAREIRGLRKQGFLRGPVMVRDEQDERRQIARLLKMATGNIELYLAEACNLRCRYCYVDANECLHGKLMPPEIARAAVDLIFARAKGVDRLQITFFGGEPLLNKPVLKETVAYSQRLARRHGKQVRYSMTTNGTLLDDEVISLIKRYGFGLMISADGPPEIHNDHRPLANGWFNWQCSYLDAFTDNGLLHLFVPHRWQRCLHLQLPETELTRLPTAPELQPGCRAATSCSN